MQDSMKFDASFTKKFFTRPEKRDAVQLLPISFKIPEKRDDLKNFFNSEDGKIYSQEVEKLTMALKERAKILGIVDDEAYKGFLRKIKLWSDYTLLTDGIVILDKIVKSLDIDQVDKWPINSQIVLQNLVDGLDVCGPGIYTNLMNAWTQLAENLEIEMQGIRSVIAQQVAENILKNSKKGLMRLFFATTMEIHNINAGVNYFHDELGIFPILDSTALRASKNKLYAVNLLIKKMPTLLSQKITPGNIIENIIMNLSLKRLESDNQFLSRLTERLDYYGEDPNFTIHMLFDEDAMVEGKIILVKNAEDLIRFSLLERLQNKGFYNHNLHEKLELQGDTIFIMKNKDNALSYVVQENGKKLSLKDYCLEKCMVEDYEILKMINRDMFNEVRNDLPKAIINEGLSLFSPPSNGDRDMENMAEMTNKWAKRFDNAFPFFIKNWKQYPGVNELIFQAAKNNGLDVLHKLSEKNVNLMQKDKKGQTALDIALESKHDNVVKFLIEYNIERPAKQSTFKKFKSSLKNFLARPVREKKQANARVSSVGSGKIKGSR